MLSTFTQTSQANGSLWIWVGARNADTELSLPNSSHVNCCSIPNLCIHVLLMIPERE